MANEQTTVPLFVAGEVLTAADMNLSAGTGVPVFSNTTTRDAGFGGAGEKVLAEGQLCYLSDSNIVQYYTGAAWATVGPTTSKIAQVVQATYAVETSTTSTSFVTSGLTATITPTLNTSKIYAVCTGGAQMNSVNILTTTIFRGTVAGTNLATSNGLSSIDNTRAATFAMNIFDSPATTSATTYTLGWKVTGSTGYIQINSSTSVLTLFEVLA